MALGWSAVESLRAWLMHRKRLALALADPVITNRFLMYGVWTGGAAMLGVTMCVISLVLSLGFEFDFRKVAIPLALAVMSAATVCVFLTFLPPQRYLRWIRQRHEELTAAAA